MQRTLYHPNSVTGGPTLLGTYRAPNTIEVQNNNAAAGDAFFAHSRQELAQPRPQSGAVGGFKVPFATSKQFNDWEGDLWAAASADGVDIEYSVKSK